MSPRSSGNWRTRRGLSLRLEKRQSVPYTSHRRPHPHRSYRKMSHTQHRLTHPRADRKEERPAPPLSILSSNLTARPPSGTHGIKLEVAQFCIPRLFPQAGTGTTGVCSTCVSYRSSRYVIPSGPVPNDDMAKERGRKVFEGMGAWVISAYCTHLQSKRAKKCALYKSILDSATLCSLPTCGSRGSGLMVSDAPLRTAMPWNP